MRLAPLLSLSAVVAATACASTPPRQYGQYSALQPRVSVVGKEGTRPQQLAVTLNQPAYVTVLFVVPGRGATVIYPPDSTSTDQLRPGTQQVNVHFPARPPRDSLRLRGLPDQGRTRRGRTGSPAPTRRDTTPRFYADTSLAAASAGYLLAIATPSPLSYAALRQRVEGISIPMDDDEALNTVLKLARSTLPEDAAWAAQSKEIDVGDGYQSAPMRPTGRP